MNPIFFRLKIPTKNKKLSLIHFDIIIIFIINFISIESSTFIYNLTSIQLINKKDKLRLKLCPKVLGLKLPHRINKMKKIENNL